MEEKSSKPLRHLGKVPRAVSVRGGGSDTAEEEEMCTGWTGTRPKVGEMAKTRHTPKRWI